MLPPAYQLPAAILFVAGGVVACFAGYRLFRVILGIYGFILGALIATSVLAPTDTPMMVLVAVGGGLAGGLILIAAYFVGVAFAGAALAALVVHLAFGQFGREPHPLVIVAACVLGALAAMALQRFVIILGTAYGGAWTLLVGALLLLARYGQTAAVSIRPGEWLAYPLNPFPDQRWMPIVWLVLGSVGLLVQLRTPARGARARAVVKTRRT